MASLLAPSRCLSGQDALRRQAFGFSRPAVQGHEGRHVCQVRQVHESGKTRAVFVAFWVAAFSGLILPAQDSAARDFPPSGRRADSEPRAEWGVEWVAPESRGVSPDSSEPHRGALPEWAAKSGAKVNEAPFDPRRPLDVFDNKASEIATPAGGYGGAESRPVRPLSDADGDEAFDTADREWIIRLADVSVRRALQRWARDAGWQLLWEPARDFPIEAEIVFRGSFRGALGSLMEALSVTDYPVQASVNSKLRIVRVRRYLDGLAR